MANTMTSEQFNQVTNLIEAKSTIRNDAGSSSQTKKTLKCEIKLIQTKNKVLKEAYLELDA